MTDPTWISGEIDTSDLARRLSTALGSDYEVVRPLGAGGFAVVFLVRDQRLKRDLAVKVLSPDVVTSSVVRERFRREAETIASLVHPNIVPLHFVGQQDDLVYLAMACIDGGSLADRLAREGRLPVADVVRLFGEIASALALAHKRGITHRDIKPQNILLDTESGRALVTDFGIARSAENNSLTATGMVVGTPAYLAPEQVTGEATDHRADLYAFGVMLYEALAGEAPFQGATPTAVLMKRVAHDPTPVELVRTEVPPALAALVRRCLARDPADRVQQAAEIVEALRTIALMGATASHVAAHAPAITTPSRAKRPFLLTALVCAVVLGMLPIWWRARSRPTAPPASAGATVAQPSAPAVDDSAMARLPSGQYTLGSNDGPADARPARTVTLDAFAMDRHEVTIGDYRRFAATGGVSPPWTTAPANDRLPVTGVVMAEASAYCAWRHPGGRLPTEAEWEAAARGLAGRRYPWGNEWIDGAANVAQANGRVESVGSHPGGRTPEGIDDLIGNVWEWTSTPYSAPGAASEPGLYVIRGGAVNAYRDVATAVHRGRARLAAPREDLALTGFRCVVPTTR
jgi:formylglycine-generating enzyme required for sulfatase activity/tRNA A-37 threonylcarbamoyl transferase component Bud32